MHRAKLVASFIAYLLIQGCATQGQQSINVAQQATAATEHVVLKNGKSYDVQTTKGFPLPFKNDQVEITGISALFNPEGYHEWSFHARLHRKEDYTVSVSTPIDDSISTSFDCAGPGEVIETFFDSERYPTVWRWFREPGTSWIPFVFHFREKHSGNEFEATQWTKFGEPAKASIRGILRQG
jgi:hypothetical protein